MTETKWTPGPWTAEKQDTWWVTSDRGEICEIMPWSNLCDKNDAHLIAAAPELYEALVDLHDAMQARIDSTGGTNAELIEMANARIILAKARGENADAFCQPKRVAE